MRGSLLRSTRRPRLRRHGRNAMVRVSSAEHGAGIVPRRARRAMPRVLGARPHDGVLLVELNDPRAKPRSRRRPWSPPGRGSPASASRRRPSRRSTSARRRGRGSATLTSGGGGSGMRLAYVAAVFGKEWPRPALQPPPARCGRFPALIFASIPTALVAFLQINDLDPDQLGQINSTSRMFPGLPPSSRRRASSSRTSWPTSS